MCGKIRLRWGKGSSSASSPSSETAKPTGTKLRKVPSAETLKLSRVIYSFDIIMHSDLLEQTILERLEFLNAYFVYGDQLVQVSHIEPGLLSPTRILRIHAPNGGLGTEVKKLLLSMNFVEELTSPMFSDGLINIRSKWKLKVHLQRSRRRPLFSPRTSTPPVST